MKTCKHGTILYGECMQCKREKNTDISESSCHVKPPLGLTPKNINDTKRLREIQGAFSRYYNAEMKIPLEWIEEYNSLIDKIKQ